MSDHPTPYPDVNAVLRDLLTSAQAILGPRFVGLYLDGSLAIGDFDPGKSDIDVLVVTDDDLPDDVVAALTAMHARIAAASAWGNEVEASYIPRRALRRFDPANARHPCIERGKASLRVEPHGTDWVVHRHVLREHGVAFAGPDLQTLIDPVTPEELRSAVRGLLHGWWAPARSCRANLDNPFYRAYAVLTMCRILYTLRHSTVATKPVASRWAQTTFPRWTALIDDARAWSRDRTPDLEQTLAFIRFTREESS